jgi:hypothetical protein
MATDMKFFKAVSADEIQQFMTEQSLTSVDVKAQYFDRPSGMHVLWYVPPASDAQGPRIAFTDVANGRPAGVELPIYVQVKRAARVTRLQLWYRTTGAPAYVGPIDFVRLYDGETYRLYIPPAIIAAPSVDYYIQGEDGDSNTTALGSAGSPKQFTVV